MLTILQGTLIEKIVFSILFDTKYSLCFTNILFTIYLHTILHKMATILLNKLNILTNSVLLTIIGITLLAIRSSTLHYIFTGLHKFLSLFSQASTSSLFNNMENIHLCAYSHLLYITCNCLRNKINIA